MNLMKFQKLVGLVVIVLLVGAAPALAQETPPTHGPQTVAFSGAALGAGLGMGITIVGAGYGLGKIGSAAVESMARQPEVAGQVQTGMLIVAAMLEGATLASVLLCYLIGNGKTF
jgi:F-type H+-transporting ATPase subunit c